MKRIEQCSICDVLYFLMIIAVLLCGDYRKITSNYEEKTGIDSWVQVHDQEMAEQQINMIQYAYRVTEQKISIFCRAENTVGDDWIEISLLQESGQHKIECGFEKIENGVQQIDIKLPAGLDPGKYVIRITPHINASTRLEIGMSQDQFNLAHAIVSGTEEHRHLALSVSYEVFELDKQTMLYRAIAIILLVSMTVTAIVCLCQGRKKYDVFICSFVITFLYIILSYFELLLDASPFIEDGLLFGESARYESFWTQCFIRDEGYLCILQHLCAWFFVRILSLGYHAYLCMNVSAVLFISLMNSLINLPVFDKVADRKIRFFVSICTPVLFARQYESYAFINCVYWGIILILLLLFIDLDTLRFDLYIGLMIAGVLICLSKGVYAILFPVSLLYLFMMVITGKCSKKKVCFWSGIGLAALGQIFCYMVAGSGAVSSSGISLQRILQLFMQTGRLILGITPMLTSFGSEIFLVVLGILVCVCGLIEFVKAITTKETRHILLTVLIALGICNSFMVGINAYYDIKEIALWYARQEFISIMAYFFVVMILVDHMKKYRNMVHYGILILVGVLCLRVLMKGYTDQITTPDTADFSVAKMDTMDWDLYGTYWDSENYFIKIMPAYFALKKNVSVDYYSAGIDYWFLGVRDENYGKDSMPCTEIPKQNISRVNVIDGTELWGIYFLKNGISYQYEAQVYDDSGNLLASASQPDSCNAKGCIIKFAKPVQNAAYIIFHDAIADREISILPEYAVVYME